MKKIDRLTLAALVMVITPAFTQQPKFDLADVHPSPTTHFYATNMGGVLRNGLYVNEDATMLQLITAAYGVTEDAIAGGPGWISYDLFDVVAKVPEGTTPANAKLMLQSLLADRFGLVIRNETRPVPRYVLTVGKGGPKLKASDGSGDPGCKMGPPPMTIEPGTTPKFKITCHNLTLAAIAENLRRFAGHNLDHDVIDSTKLQGSWDFDLEWTDTVSAALNGISIFDAVDKQLGLKLELQNIPMPALAIEKVNRRPTDNPPAIATMLAIPPARFEVASVKPVDPSSRPFMGPAYTGGSQIHLVGTLRLLIAVAYQVPMRYQDDMVVGLPKSADTQRWDILGKLPSTGLGAPSDATGRPMPPPLSVAQEMLRGVLLDQFELKAHTENREVTVWALTLHNGTPKMIQANDSERTGCKGDPSAPKPSRNIPYMVHCQNESMAQLAESLQRMAGGMFDHPIVDDTGLKGGWDFYLGWTPNNQMQSQPPNPASNPDQAAVTPASDPGDVPIFDALERQVGLKAVKEKRSIPVLVVDHVDEKPIQ